MNRYTGDNRPHVKPVMKIELSEKNIKRRVLCAALFAVVGIAAIAYGILHLFRAESGWEKIQVSSSSAYNCGDDFVFQYLLGEGELSANAEKKALTALYTEAAEYAFWLFNADETPGETGAQAAHNICYINDHPNEEIVVEETLYRALEQLKMSGNRYLYLGPLYARYDDMFYCQDDAQAEVFDPYRNESAAEEYRTIASYASDENAVEVELLGDNRIRLKVSKEYLEYAKEEGVESFIDFFWMKNAFITDYLADTLIGNGYTRGALSSFDGYTRNLDVEGQLGETTFSYNIYDLVEHELYPAAVMEYTGAISIVTYRDYKRTAADMRYYYEYSDGEMRTSYLSVEDGRCRSALHDLTVYSERRSCAELMLASAPLYIADSLDKAALEALSKNESYVIYCEDRSIYHSEPELRLDKLYQDDSVRYQMSPDL